MDHVALILLSMKNLKSLWDTNKRHKILRDQKMTIHFPIHAFLLMTTYIRISVVNEFYKIISIIKLFNFVLRRWGL